MFEIICTMVHNMSLAFEWDQNKETSNLDKHGISFVTAAELLLSEHYVARTDRHNEPRYLTIGEVYKRVLAVVYTTRENNYRIISVRRASQYEEETYRKYCEASGAYSSCR
jgi:uncharacterized DUF497 family protein